MKARSLKAIVVAGFVMVAAQAGLGAQDSLSAAKDLYASAAYEDALTTLTRLTDGATAPEIARQVDEYRAFCLYALGRTGEAESVAESIIRREPLMKLDAADASPRLEMMFSNVRKRLLPALIRDRFRTARSALDQKNLSAAEPPLVEARLMIAEAEKLGVKDDGLADLTVLVDGFLQLVRTTPEQRPAPQPAAGIPPDAASLAARQRVEPLPAPSAVNSPHVYTVDDVGVTPPVVLSQRMPSMTPEMLRVVKAMNTNAILDVLIDERGDVMDAIIRKSLNPSFDNLVAGAARRWKYRPAVKDGVAVRYTKTIVLVP
jgi:Gram-negative bacterial TonB protein C-terminal